NSFSFSCPAFQVAGESPFGFVATDSDGRWADFAEERSIVDLYGTKAVVKFGNVDLIIGRGTAAQVEFLGMETHVIDRDCRGQVFGDGAPAIQGRVFQFLPVLEN